MYACASMCQVSETPPIFHAPSARSTYLVEPAAVVVMAADAKTAEPTVLGAGEPGAWVDGRSLETNPYRSNDASHSRTHLGTLQVGHSFPAS